jgi:hypothetical protein
LDHDSLALLTALNELDGIQARARVWDPAKHPRNPPGSPGGGRFRSMVDRLKDAIQAHLNGDGDGHPFDGFDREQLRKVAKSRGIELKRGESRDSIAEKLLGHLHGGKTAKPGKARPAGKVAESAKPYHRNLNGIEDLADAVEHGHPLRERRALTGGVSAETELRTLKDGTKVVYKYGGNPDNEHGASMIARALGLDAPRVYRNERNAVYMDYVDNAKTFDQVMGGYGYDYLSKAEQDALQQRRNDAIDSDDGKLLGLLDLMIVNGDRNPGNWMVTDSGKVVPIDHGHTFLSAYIGKPGSRIRVHRLSTEFTSRYLITPTRFGPNDLTHADVDEIRSRLEKLRPDFEHIGRKRWLDYALAVLDEVGPYALGTRNLVAGIR